MLKSIFISSEIALKDFQDAILEGEVQVTRSLQLIEQDCKLYI